ncbi:Ig-like domain-containing protein, partial [bacterium]|nr:Ig-like domain-containing protein [bacterium]
MYKKIIILTLMAFLVISFRSSAQDLTVTNVSIADQSVNVDTSVTLTMTFSEELRPFKAGFEFDDVVEIGPDNNIRVTNIRVSGVTISADFILQSNTTYQISLSNEFLQARDGSTLPDMRTNVVTFSTGASLDAGSVSGTITPAVDLSEVPAYAGLLQQTEDDMIFYRGIKVNSDGTYTIPNA